MKGFFRLSFLLLFLLGIAGVAYAATPISWEDDISATYDTSVPGTILIWETPLSQGGMNLSNGKMTSGKDADVVFTSEGEEIGANGIYDLGDVDYDAIDEIQDSGYQKVVDALPGHVYILKLADGSIVKLEIQRNLGSAVKFRYAFGESQGELPDGTPVTYDMSVPGTILVNSDPTNQGGLNFSDAVMTNKKDETDIAISGDDIGSRGIIDLGEVDMNEVDASSIPDSGFSKFADLKSGHVYITLTHDGEFIKFYVVGVYSSTVELIFQVIGEDDDQGSGGDDDDGTMSDIVSIELVGPDRIGWEPVTLSVEATYTDDSTDTIPNSEVTWETSDDSVGTITDDGEFQLTGEPGEVTITATYDGLESSITYTVRTLTSLKINQSLKYSGAPVTLTVTGSFSDKTSAKITSGVTWKSSNTKVATVDSKGVVKFTGNSGSVTITATYLGKTAKVTVTVGNVVKSLSSTTKLAYSKKPVTIAISAVYSNGKKVALKKGVTWKSSNTNVAKVSSSGVVTFTGKNGEVTITATYQGRSLSFKVKVFNKENELKFYTGKKWKLYMDYVGLYVGTLQLNSNGTYTWDNPNQGKITGKWEMNKSNTITLYKFGYNQNKTFVMERDSKNPNEILLMYAPGETGTSDYYVGK